MNLYDEKLQPVNTEMLVAEILGMQQEKSDITEEQAAEAAEEMYAKASETFNEIFGIAAAESFVPPGLGKKIIEWIRRQICKFLNPGSTTQDIIDKILEELAKLMPFGMVIKNLVIRVIRYFINLGYEALCTVA